MYDIDDILGFIIRSPDEKYLILYKFNREE